MKTITLFLGLLTLWMVVFFISVGVMIHISPLLGGLLVVWNILDLQRLIDVFISVREDIREEYKRLCREDRIYESNKSH